MGHYLAEALPGAKLSVFSLYSVVEPIGVGIEA